MKTSVFFLTWAFTVFTNIIHQDDHESIYILMVGKNLQILHIFSKYILNFKKALKFVKFIIIIIIKICRRHGLTI